MYCYQCGKEVGDVKFCPYCCLLYTSESSDVKPEDPTDPDDDKKPVTPVDPDDDKKPVNPTNPDDDTSSSVLGDQIDTTQKNDKVNSSVLGDQVRTSDSTRSVEMLIGCMGIAAVIYLSLIHI